MKLPRCTPPPPVAQPLAEVYALAFQHSLEATATAAASCRAAAAVPHTVFFFGNFRSEIQTWESTSFGAKLG